jgi:hypothetical protein
MADRMTRDAATILQTGAGSFANRRRDGQGLDALRMTLCHSVQAGRVAAKFS